MPQDGCGAGECIDCHTLNKQEAATLLKGKVTEVIDVKRSEVPGLWAVEAIFKGRKIPLYIDFSKEYLLNGNIVRLSNNENLTRQSFIKMNKVDISLIPLENAVILGDPNASHKIIVFDDPNCTFCKKLHPEMEKVVTEHPDIAFFIKMFPLKMHPEAYDNARAIICAKIQESNDRALTLLSDSLAGKALPKPACESDQVAENIALVKKLFISSTPTLVLPDGQVLPGYKEAAQIVKIIKPKSP
jgi:thiol:disulfide interchange protein DsbC